MIESNIKVKFIFIHNIIYEMHYIVVENRIKKGRETTNFAPMYL